jgi:hypothetical protein
LQHRLDVLQKKLDVLADRPHGAADAVFAAKRLRSI